MKLSSTFIVLGSLASQSNCAPYDRVPLYLYVDGGSGSSASVIEEEYYKMADSGVSTIILAFYLTDNPAFPSNMSDAAGGWAALTAQDRSRIHAGLLARGTSLLLSAGGEAEAGKWVTHDPTEYGTSFCTTARNADVDGVDFDLEGIARIDTKISNWLHQSALACKKVFPNAIITSAPQSPYEDPAFGGGSHGNGWCDILIDGAQDGGTHDHILTQYYNQGSYYAANDYTSLFTSDKPYSISHLMRTYPNVSPTTFVVGKPLLPRDASAADWVDLDSLRSFGCRAWRELQWRGGFMFWQHHFGEDPNVFETYDKFTQPCDPQPNTTTTTTTPTQTPTRSIKPSLTTSSRPTTTPSTTTVIRTTPSATTGTITRTTPSVTTATITRTTVTTATTTRTKPSNTTATTTRTKPSNTTAVPTTGSSTTTSRAPTTVPSTVSTPRVTTQTVPTVLSTTGAKSVTGSGPWTTVPTAKPDPATLIQQCEQRIFGVIQANTAGCQDLCTWYGGTGMIQCHSTIQTVNDLLECVVRLNTWCAYA